MRKLKQYKIVLAAVVLAAVGISFGETLIGSWNMDGTPVTKTVGSIMSNDGYPNGGFVEEERTVLEYPWGDVVFGWPREGLRGSTTTSIPEQSEDGGGASGEPGDKSLLIKGALNQSAHIGEVFREITGAFKITMDFKLYEPGVWANEGANVAIISGGLNRFETRVFRGAGGTANVTLYCYRATGGADSVATEFTVDVDGWNSVEFGLEDGIMFLKLNDDDVVTKPLNAAFATVDENTYDGLTIGARWDGNGRWARAYLDNIELYSLDERCGAWGFLPVDFNEDCVVDIEDLAVLVDSWLVCTDPQVEGCVDLY